MTTCEICRGAGTVVDYLHRRDNGWPEVRREPCPACSKPREPREPHEQRQEKEAERPREILAIAARAGFSFLTFLAELAACLVILGVLWTILAGVIMFGGVVYPDEGRKWR